MKLLYYGIIICFLGSSLYGNESGSKPRVSPTPPLALPKSGGSSGSVTPSIISSPRDGAKAPQKQRPGNSYSASEGSTTASTRTSSPARNVKPLGHNKEQEADDIERTTTTLMLALDPKSLTTRESLEQQITLLKYSMLATERLAQLQNVTLNTERREHEKTIFNQLRQGAVNIEKQKEILHSLILAQTSHSTKLTSLFNKDYEELGINTDAQSS